MDELYHHGIKGMHWGVRRYQNPDGTLTEAGKKRYGSQYKTYDEAIDAYKSNKRMDRAMKTGNFRKLSDDELAKVNRRLSAELTVKKAMDQLNPPRQHRARKVIADIAEASAKDLAKTAITKLGQKLFTKVDDTKSDFSIKDFANLTDKQIKDYESRQKSISSIIGIQKKLDSMKEEEKKQKEDTQKEKKQKEDTQKEKKQKEDTPKEKKETTVIAKKMPKEPKRIAEQKAQSSQKKEDELSRNNNISKSKIDSWMKDSYTKAINSKPEYDMDDWLERFYHSDLGQSFLAHHGVKGQKWGVKHGPPYPLDDAISTGKKIKSKQEASEENKTDKRSSNSLSYLADGWYGSSDNKDRTDEQVEAGIKMATRISDEIWDRYDNKPHSEAAKKLQKEYEESLKSDKELASLRKESNRLHDEYRRAYDDFDKKLNWNPFASYKKLVQPSLDKYHEASKKLNAYEKQREEQYHEAMFKVVLKELGYPITEENLKAIDALTRWD